MSRAKVVLVGVGGYGDLYITLYQRSDWYKEKIDIVGVIDPFVEKAAKYEWIKAQNIPVYDTIEEFFGKKTADLAVISTPISLHKSQCITALKNGANVLCEKPLAPVVQDVLEIAEVEKESGKRLGVGFQWSFSNSMNKLKSDILKGSFGKPLSLKSLICWKRYDEYYNTSTWKGRINDSSGNLILDSVVTNATAHYLHNIFFVLGDSQDTSAMPRKVKAEVYRAKEIESFDTVVLSGSFDSGATFWYGATHSGHTDDVTTFLYKFENADICFNTFKRDDHVYAKYQDGRVVDYGNPQAFEELHPKFMTMINASLDKNTVIPCGIDTIMPHLKVCNGLFCKVGIDNLPSDIIKRAENPSGTFVVGMQEDIERLYKTEKLPSEDGCSWAVPFTVYSPYEINFFDGVKQK